MSASPIDLLTNADTQDDDHELRGNELPAVCYVLLVLVFASVSLRVYIRAYVQRWFGYDDVLIIVSFLTNVTVTAIVLLGLYQYGWRSHVWDIPPSKVPESLQFDFAAKILFFFASCNIRVALLLFYYRLADPKVRWYHYTLHASMAFVIGLFLAGLFTTVFNCTPVHHFWSPNVWDHDNCINEEATDLALGVLSSVSNFVLFLLSVPIMLSLKRCIRLRVWAGSLFVIGMLACAAGAMRTYYLHRTEDESLDFSWVGYPTWFTSVVEVNIGLMCACAPAFQPLIMRATNPFARNKIIKRPARFTRRLSKHHRSFSVISGVTQEEFVERSSWVTSALEKPQISAV